MYRDLTFTVDVPFRDLTFGGVPDPRVTVIDFGTTGADTATEIFAPAKYPASTRRSRSANGKRPS